MRLNTLVLGGCGFIGSHVVDALLSAGHRVAVLDRSPAPKHRICSAVTCHQGTITDALLTIALRDIDVVYHLASGTNPATSQLDPIADFEDNVIVTLRLLEAMRLSRCRRIVYFSSGGTVYGRTTSAPVDEDHPTRPICSHGVVKLTVEKYLAVYKDLHRFQPVVLRVANAYGARQGKYGVQGLIATCLDRALRDETIDIWGNGLVVRDYIHAQDVAQMALLVGENCPQEEVFNVGSGQGTSINGVLDLVQKVTGRQLKVARLAARAFDAPNATLCIDRARSVLGWRARIALEEGIDASWTYLMSHPRERRRSN